MVAASDICVTHPSDCLTYADARWIAREAMASRGPARVCIDLKGTTHTSTRALAMPIYLRSNLLKAGRDLRIVGLSGRAEGPYSVHQLGRGLPREDAAEGPCDANEARRSASTGAA
jgi:hypothetical protein